MAFLDHNVARFKVQLVDPRLMKSRDRASQARFAWRNRLARERVSATLSHEAFGRYVSLILSHHS